MITAVHTLIYSDDAPATRAFFRDVLDLTWVSDHGSSEEGSDPKAASSWLIFDTGPSELGVHPTVTVWEGTEHRSPRQHLISFMCDDLAATMAELRSKGATFAGEPADRGFGLVAMLEVPGTDPIMVYEPRHTTAYGL